MTALLDDLNPEQRSAVLHESGALLILAGAGSGKTRVITRRIAHLILERRVDPQRVLAITFTNKAAREMKERVLKFVPLPSLWIATFHSTAARILRREAPEIGLSRDFTIYDTYDRNQCIRNVIREMQLDEQRWRPAAVGQAISSRKNRGLAPGEPDPDTGYVEETLARLEKAYAELMARSEALDFDDLLLKLHELLNTKPEVSERYAERFQHVLVDEYQDTNALQYRITKLLARTHRNLCVCGDPDQSIYGWRGADLRNILDFERDFAPATVVRLETNYRSTKRILAAAQGVIEHNKARKEKTLRTENAEGEKLVAMVSHDELDEARSIVGRVRALVGEGRKHADIAVFYRANFLQRALERGLRDAGIPYRVAAGLEFYERREIKDLLAYLRLIANPNDDVSFERIVNVPTRGIGDTSVDKLRGEASKRGLPFARALALPEVRGAMFTARVKMALDGFLELLGRLAPLADGPAEQALEAVIRETKYDAHCGDLGDPGDTERIENVRELVASAAEYDAREPEGGVRGYLGEVALVSDIDGLGEEADRVTLMTLHSAKGLEFPVVFIAGVEEGLVPHRRAVEERSGGEGLEEERRLFFVGLTRARERCFLSWARSRSQFGSMGMGGATPSRFLSEIPQSAIEDLDRDTAAGEDAFEGGGYGDEPEAALPRAASPKGLVAGAMVRHDHFGVGRVVETRGSGANARAVIHFQGGVGEKQLLLQYARLDLLETRA